jgi:anti-sigma28 factor (negative regulator of flagellin synthesis)
MHINQVNPQGVAAYRRPVQQQEQVANAYGNSSQAPRDTAELSSAAQVESADAARVSDDAVARVKAEIASGTYLTEERINGAIDKLFGELTSTDSA